MQRAKLKTKVSNTQLRRDRMVVFDMKTSLKQVKIENRKKTQSAQVGYIRTVHTRMFGFTHIEEDHLEPFGRDDQSSFAFL